MTISTFAARLIVCLLLAAVAGADDVQLRGSALTPAPTSSAIAEPSHQGGAASTMADDISHGDRDGDDGDGSSTGYDAAQAAARNHATHMVTGNGAPQRRDSALEAPGPSEDHLHCDCPIGGGECRCQCSRPAEQRTQEHEELQAELRRRAGELTAWWAAQGGRSGSQQLKCSCPYGAACACGAAVGAGDAGTAEVPAGLAEALTNRSAALSFWWGGVGWHGGGLGGGYWGPHPYWRGGCWGGCGCGLLGCDCCGW